MKYYVQTTLCMALLTFVLSGCSEDEEKKSLAERISFDMTEVLRGAAYEYIELTIKGYTGGADQVVFINGVKAEMKGIYEGTSRVRLEVPFGAGSGRIELQQGSERIQGPMFEYLNTYVGFSSSDIIGTSLARYTDNSLVAWESQWDKTFSIIEFGALSASDDPSITIIRRKQKPTVVPNSDLRVGRLIENIGMATSPDKEVFFYQEYYEGSRDSDKFQHQLLATDFNSTGYVQGYGTSDFGPIIDVEIDSKGNIFTCEAGKSFIRKQAGAIETFAGAGTTGHRDGTGAEAQFTQISAMTLDKADNLYVADDRYIRKITPAGVVTTIAGMTEAGSGDGPAPDARFGHVKGIFMAVDGKLYIADAGNNAIRVLDTNGLVTTLVGAGVSDSDDAETIHMFVDADGTIFTMTPSRYNSMVVYVPDSKMTKAQFEKTRHSNGNFSFGVEDK